LAKVPFLPVGSPVHLKRCPSDIQAALLATVGFRKREGENPSAPDVQVGEAELCFLDLY